MLGLLSFLYLYKCVFVYLCISHLIHGNVIIDILESRAFKKYRFFLVLVLLTTLYFCICIFVYLCILHLIHGNVIFYLLESHAFQKYSTCLVF